MGRRGKLVKLTLGKTYRIGRRGSTSALALPFQGEVRLVRWERHTETWVEIPLNCAVTYANEPSVEEVLCEWGCPLRVLDGMVEEHFYSHEPDVLAVRRMESRRV